MSRLGNIPQLAHRLDHVDGNADRPGMVGDGAGDRSWRIHHVAAYVLNLLAAAVFGICRPARIRPVLPSSWMMSRNDNPRLRYFLAIETTRRRLPPDSLRLASSYLLVNLADLRRRGCGGSVRLRERGPQVRSVLPGRLPRSSPGSFIFLSSSIRCSSSTIFVLIEESFFISGVTFARAKRKTLHAASPSDDAGGGSRLRFFKVFLAGDLRSASHSSRLHAASAGTTGEVQRSNSQMVPLSAMFLGRRDLHRPVERQIAVVDLLENLQCALKKVIALQNL